MASPVAYQRTRKILDIALLGFVVPAPGPVSFGIYDARGYTRIRGILTISVGMTISVRVRQSDNGVNFDIVDIIPQDLIYAPPPIPYTYIWDIPIVQRFIQMDATLTAGGPITSWRGSAQLMPL